MLKEMFWHKHPVQQCPLHQFILHFMLLRLTRKEACSWKSVRGVQLPWQDRVLCVPAHGSSTASLCRAGNRGTATPSGVPSRNLLGQAQASHTAGAWLSFPPREWLPRWGLAFSWASALLKTWKVQHMRSELPFLKDLRAWLLAHPYRNRPFSVLM